MLKEKKNNMKEIHAELTNNFKAFSKMEFPDNFKGRFVLLHHGKKIDTLDTKTDAHKMGKKLFPNGVYSIQEIKPEGVDLGYMSYALYQKPVIS